MDLEQKIVHIRDSKKISKADMAKALDMLFSNYHRLEKRGNKLTLEQIGMIAKALGVSVIELLTYGDTEPQTQESADLVKEIQTLKDHIQDLSDRLTDSKKMNDVLTENQSLREQSAKIYYEQMKSLEKKVDWDDSDNAPLQLMLSMLQIFSALGGIDKDD